MRINSDLQKLTGSKVKAAKPLTVKQAQASLKNIVGWNLSVNNKKIYRNFVIQDYIAAINLINRIAGVAKEEKHHPDIHLTEYRKLRVELTTHEVGGLSEQDFIEAGRINELPVELKPWKSPVKKGA